jgi:hypothetical protein
MNIHMNEPHGILDITSLFNNKFHEERTWVCLDIIDEIGEPSLWHWIGFLLIPKCAHSYHSHANEKDIRTDD